MINLYKLYERKFLQKNLKEMLAFSFSFWLIVVAVVTDALFQKDPTNDVTQF
jgi:hypothetical protein